MKKVEYTQSTNYLGDDLSYLTGKKGGSNDPKGVLDEVHILIERFGADLIHLFVEDAIGTCGIANRYDLYDENFVENSCTDDPNPDACVVQKRKELWKYKSFSVSAIPEGCRIQNTFSHELGA